MGDQNIDELVDEYGEETVKKAFWLQEHIYEEGLEGANFTDEAKKKIRQNGPLLIKNAIDDEFTTSI